MNFRSINKFFGLLVLYIVIIFGIFFLQFRNESAISENFGQLRLSLVGNNTDTSDFVLSNQFSVAFNGLRFFSNDKQRMVAIENQKETEAVLSSWEKLSDLSFQLSFTDKSIIVFSASDNTKNAKITINAIFPPNSKISTIRIPYKMDKTLEVSDLNASRLLAKSTKAQFILMSSEINENEIFLAKGNPQSVFMGYTPKQYFSFDLITELDNATQGSWNLTKKQLGDNLVSKYPLLSTTTVTEKMTVAYLSEMLSRHDYQNALAIAQNLLLPAKRTYLSTPYLNNLVATSAGLSRARTQLNTEVRRAADTNSLSVFEIPNIDQYLLTENEPLVTRILAIPANIDFTPTAKQAAGVLSVYSTFFKNKKTSTDLLSPYIETCLSVIEKSCNLSDTGLLFIQDDNNLLSTLETVEIAVHLISYGKLFSAHQYEAGGYLLLNSILASPDTISLAEIGDLYQFLDKGNTTYPHYQLLAQSNTEPVWAWTIATSITSTKIPADQITLSIDFPLEYSHHIIISAIPAFNDIEIYGLRYRTDPRFESYNSSGYVYNTNTKTLLLKSRHKTQNEIINLYYGQPRETVIEEVVTETEVPAEPATL